MSIKLKLEGFEDLLKEIEAAEGSIKGACESAIKQSAQTMQSELKSEMKKANVPNDLINAMPQFEVKSDGNRVTARVGYKKGTYNPKNLSDGYKIVFLNYGTPHRSKHGKVVARGFIQKAKKNAKRKIKNQQKEALEKILKRLKK